MWFNWKQSIVVFLIFGICFCAISGQTLYDGSICTHRGQAGICRVITKCTSILAEVLSKRLGYDQMVSCGFKGKDPIICCPNDVSDRFDTGTTSTTEEIFTFDLRGNRSIDTTTSNALITFNNLTVPNEVPFIDLTKLLSEKNIEPSVNQIEGRDSQLENDAGWFQAPSSPKKNENIEYIGNVYPFEVNNQLENDEQAHGTAAPFNPDDPFSIYSFREQKETSRTGTVVTKSTDRWVWYSSTSKSIPFDFPPSSGRTTTSSTTPRSVTRTEVGVRAREACDRYSKDAPAPLGFQILGGVPASPGEFPHMVAFGYRDVSGLAWNCAGSLISERYILTAAHCVARESNLPQVIRLGKTSLDTDEDAAESVDITLERIILHPNYVPSQNYHDIALIRLSRDAPLGSFIRPACLYTDERDNAASVPLVATGWGTVNPETRDKSNVLLKVNLTIVELSSCNQTHVSIGLDRRLRNGLNRGQMCAFMNNKDTCEGDSGGPLQLMDQYSISTIVGITSFGLSCGSNVPSVYARVAFYLDWIENTVWPF